jgi:TPR repeat protein
VLGDPLLSAATPAATAGAPDVPTVDVGELLARGDAYLGKGDVTSARLFYERAADAGSRQAAMRLGATFDANFLDRAGFSGTRGDQSRADMWYRRARGLGTAEAASEAKARVTK